MTMLTHSNELHPHLQAAFNIVVAGLASQGFERSLANLSAPNGGTFEGCAYRGEHGRRCAAGWLIKDEHYSPDLEKTTVCGHPPTQAALLKSGVCRELFPFVGQLQRIHDNEDEDYNIPMQEQLLNFAIEHELIVPPELRP
jgi:hypothetical protein